MLKNNLTLFIVGVLLSNSMPLQGIAIDWVTVGDAGNNADEAVLAYIWMVQFGNVAYEYRIGKHEVTNSQYSAFLNAVAAADNHNLYNPNMGSSYYGGIERSGSPGSYTYCVKSGRGNNPVNYVSWYDTLRFSNWLHNGQLSGVQDNSTTEDGAYTMSLGGLAQRNSGARVFLASENEWYKAAYYKGGGISAGYWDYATQSNLPPTSIWPPGENGSANYYDGGYAVGGQHISDVGAYASSTSAYGTFDQNGNVYEWVEDGARGTLAGKKVRGGSWNDAANHLSASVYIESYYNQPENETPYVGFRVAAIPEPATMMLLLLTGGICLFRRQRGTA